MQRSFYDIRPPVLMGEKRSGGPCRFAEKMENVVKACGERLPKGLCMITRDSPLSYKKAVEAIGVYFTREMRYDFRPFSVSEYSNRVYRTPSNRTNDENTRSFLWVNADGYPGHWETYGACTFRRTGDTWYLKWVWLHPYERRKGHLRTAWPFFRSMFGVFVPDAPISPALQEFMRKVGYEDVLKSELKRTQPEERRASKARKNR